MSIVLTSPEQLQDAIRQVIGSVLEEIVPDLVREGTQKPYLTQEEMRELTSWSNRKLRYLRESNQIEFVALGRSYVYPTGAVLKFLDEKRIRVRRDDVPKWTGPSDITNKETGPDLSHWIFP